ncbi:uncharacterized protein ACRADG_004326 isoform 1-T1 [Cochliomyia hominivorax]
MGSKIVNLEIFLIYFFLLIPWPHTHVIKRLCSKDSSRLVRKIVRSKWTPILDKYQVKLPLECPLHPFRDIFAPRQDAKKRDRPTQWTCRLCGKSFYQEKFLDLHFETRHKNVINEAEDAVCLADYCDIMRCEVFQSEESSSLKLGDQTVVTDIEVWGDSLGQNSALAKANVAYLSLLPIRTSSTGASSRAAKVQNRQYCQDKIGQTATTTTTKCHQQTDSHQNSNENLYNNNHYNGAAKRSKYSPTPQSSSDSLTSSAAPHTSPHSSSSSSSSKSHTHKHSASATTTKHHHHHQTSRDTSSSEDSNGSKSGQSRDNNSDDDEADDDGNNAKSNTNTSADESNKTSSAQSANTQKIRASCKTEELSKLKAKCEYLVRSCIGGLILSMTDQQFKDMEEEMNKAVCWYLTCERYWEDGPLESRAFPWGLILILIFVFSCGVCFCYYIIWILFDSEETTINATTNHHLYIPNTHNQLYHPQHQQQQQQLHHSQQQTMHHQDHYLFQDYPTTGIHHGMTNVEPQTNTSYYYQHHPQRERQQADLLHYQQAMQHDIYPEPLQYDYRRSPRRYIGDQRLPGTPTITMSSSGGAIGGGQTPLRHQPTNLAYQQDILDRRDYISRPIGYNARGPNSGSTGALSHHSAQMDCDNTLPATHLGSGGGSQTSMVGGGGGSVKYYNTIPRPLETRQRYVSGSQQSLRASSSSHEIIQNEVGHNEHYIYVTYPPDLKKRFFEKYE